MTGNQHIWLCDGCLPLKHHCSQSVQFQNDILDLRIGQSLPAATCCLTVQSAYQKVALACAVSLYTGLPWHMLSPWQC